jgi:hypothetical protein
MPRVRELLDIPERVEKGQFQITLSEGVARPQQTVEEYVVTPRLADAFDRALGIIDTALEQRRSVGVYLHGSFGSGKSHFMAMLSLLLADHELAWRRPEFDRLRAKFGWIGTLKVLELHMHMLGKASLEAAIYPAYLEHLATHHPDAPVPALFADKDLFENATELLDELGDQRFFARLNERAGGAERTSVTAADAWSFMGAEAVAGVGAWDRRRFEDAIASQDIEVRQGLLDALLRTHFKAFRGAISSFRPLEEGLGILTEHARQLGYGAVVLFLDELILRLSYGASEPRWLSDMVQSMVKLVERQTGHLALPLISFIARQRLLDKLVGDRLAGPDIALLREQLSHSKGRFGEIELPNEELPEIISQRVLRPGSEAAKHEIDAAFESLQRAAQSGREQAAWNTLTAARYDAAQFRKLYPFSPALVEALINLSGSLQRQRTAIKLLSELLVEHIEDLELGELVGVGDLFDLLAVGEEAADGIMRELFERAKKLYTRKLLPTIQAEHGTDTPARCQRLRDDHVNRLGCSNCGEKPCRNDNRMAKTMLVAALAPEGVLKDLTVSRLLDLNHGKIRSRLPGQESKKVAATIRKWANTIEEIRIGEGPDPDLNVELLGVELKPIMAKAAAENTAAKRTATLRKLLFEAMQLPDYGGNETGIEEKVMWRGTARRGEVRFGNVRLMGAEQLRCPDEHDWRLIIDFPFDEEGHGPHEDEAALERFREEHESTWTLVWLPSFFARSINDLLGDLVILNHILGHGGDGKTQLHYVQHLSSEQQEIALNLMRGQQSHKRMQVLDAMRKAYGITSATPDDDQLDRGRRIDRHLHLLSSHAHLRPQLAADLHHALDRYIAALLDERYPQHPRLSRQLTAKFIEGAIETFDRLHEREDGRLELDAARLRELDGTLGQLGLVSTSETALLRRDEAVQELERACAQHNVAEPSAENVVQWFDPEGKKGLQPPVQALVVRALARASKRTLVWHDGSRRYEFQPGKPMPGAVLLRKPELPSQVDWEKGLATAARCFGLTLPGRVLHAENLERFAAALERVMTDKSEAALALPGALLRWYSALELATDGDEGERRRLITAISARELISSLRGQPSVEQIRALAGFAAKTSGEAVGRSLATANASVRVLDSNLTRGVFEQLARRGSEDAIDLVEQARKLLRQNELEASIAELLPRLAERGQALLVEHTPPASGVPMTVPFEPEPRSPGWRLLAEHELTAEGRAAAIAAVEALLAELRGQTSVRVRVRGRVWIEGEDEP